MAALAHRLAVQSPSMTATQSESCLHAVAKSVARTFLTSTTFDGGTARGVGSGREGAGVAPADCRAAVVGAVGAAAPCCRGTGGGPFAQAEHVRRTKTKVSIRIRMSTRACLRSSRCAGGGLTRVNSATDRSPPTPRSAGSRPAARSGSRRLATPRVLAPWRPDRCHARATSGGWHSRDDARAPSV